MIECLFIFFQELNEYFHRELFYTYHFFHRLLNIASIHLFTYKIHDKPDNIILILPISNAYKSKEELNCMKFFIYYSFSQSFTISFSFSSRIITLFIPSHLSIQILLGIVSTNVSPSIISIAKNNPSNRVSFRSKLIYRFG